MTCINRISFHKEWTPETWNSVVDSPNRRIVHKLDKMETMQERAGAYFRNLQERICSALEEIDGTGRFREDIWERLGGGGG